MRRAAEWRPELVELADDSVSSTDATIPSSPRGARSMTGSTEAHLYVSNVERRWAWVRECKTSHRTTSNHTRIDAAPGDAEERRTEIETRQSAARPPRRTAHANTATRAQIEKRELRAAKRTSDRKDESKSMEK